MICNASFPITNNTNMATARTIDVPTTLTSLNTVSSNLVQWNIFKKRPDLIRTVFYTM